MTPHLLIASADPKIRERVRQTLSHEDIELVFCGDGMEAMESLKKSDGKNFCLCILEMFLPKIDGFDLIHQMEEIPSLSKIPILMLLSSSQREVKEAVIPILSADDYLKIPFTDTEIAQRTHSMTKYFREHASPHPVTALPGHPQMEKEIVSRLKVGESLSLLWLDINHFRPFNDHRGRKQGDEVIRITANLLRSEEPNLLAHVDGDDFIVLAEGSRLAEMRERLRENFQREIQQFYSKEEREQGFFYEKDRDQKKQIFPLMSLSCAILPVKKENFNHYGELVACANDLLHQAKLGAQEVK